MTAPETQQVEAAAQHTAGAQPSAATADIAVPGAATAFAFLSAGHVPDASHLNGLQRAAGNGAVGRLLSGVQRSPIPSPKTKAKKGPSASYEDLFDAFQGMTAKAINDGGAGLDNVPFGRDLNADHLRLLESVREVLDQARVAGSASRGKLAVKWQTLAAKLQKAVNEARRYGLSAEVLSAVADDIDLLGRDFVGARKTTDEIAHELFGDESEFIGAMEGMLYEFLRMAEAGPGMLREEVPNRKDAYVSEATRQINKERRDAINGTPIGKDIVGRHLDILHTLRKTLVTARSEEAGSAYRALATWRSIEADLRHIRDQGLHLGAQIAHEDPKLIEQTRQALEAHYAAVHQDNLSFLLTKERSAAQAESERKLERTGSDEAIAAAREVRAYGDLEHALDIIQNGIKPNPDVPGEWILTSGQTVMRVRDDQVQGLRQAAPGVIKHYASLSAQIADDAYQAFEDRRKKNKEHPIVHGLVSWSADIDDLDELEMFGKQQQAQSMFKQIRSLADKGDLVAAFRVARSLEIWSVGFAGQVGKWEADLIGSAGRWVLGLTIVKEVLTLLATAGAGDLIAGAKAARGVSGLRATAEVAGATTTAGAVGGGGGYLAGQALTGGDVSGGDLAKATRVGGGTGLTIGAGPGAVASAKETLGVGKAASTIGNVARGATAEVIGNTPVNVAGALISGDSVKDATLSTVASSVVSGGGSQALAKVAQGGKVAKTVVGAGVGGTAGTAGALAAGKDRDAVITSAVLGTAGGGLGPHLAESNEAYRKGGGGGDGGGGAGGGTKPPTQSIDEKFDLSDVTTATTGGKGSRTGTPGGGGISGKFDLSDVGGSPPTTTSEPTGTSATSDKAVTTLPSDSAPTGSTSTTKQTTSTVGSTSGSPRGSSDVTTAPATSSDAALASTPAQDVGSADTMAGGSKAPAGGSSGGSSGSVPDTTPKARPLLPGSQLPADLPLASKPAFDFHAPGRGVDTRADVEPGVGPSVPTVQYPAEEAGRYVATGEKPVAGVSKAKAYVVQDTTDNNKKYLFKPLAAEIDIDRAQARGIRRGEQAPRDVAASIAAQELGVPAAKTKLATVDGKPGVLIEWHEQNSLTDLYINDPQGFLKLVNSEKFRAAMTGLDALDYLINNLDRAQNFGNYLYEFLPDGTLKLTAIDHGLTFTSTKARASIVGWTRDLPESYPPDLAKNLRELSANRDAFVAKIKPLVGDEAIPGVLQRLDAMVADMNAKEHKP